MSKVYWAVCLAGEGWLGPTGLRPAVGKTKRREFTRREALRAAADFEDVSVVYRVRRKPAPELKVGDRVAVLGTLVRREAPDYSGRLDACIEGKTGTYWVQSVDIVRAAKEK